jgi:ligand-binding sensor domain-containing protein
MKSNFEIKILLTMLILFSSSMAQNNKPRFSQLPLDKGVSLNLTYDMIQDSKGFLWFGTMYGLVKYDGEKYTAYKYNPDNTNSISFDDIVSIYEDSKGNLWIGTWGGGLNMFDVERKIFKRFLHNPDNRNSIVNNIVWSVCEDRDGMIWIGTGSGGLQIFNPYSGEFKNLDLMINDSTNIKPSIKTLLADDNLIWIGHSKGLSSFNLRTTNMKHFNLNGTNGRSGGNPFVNTIYKDSKRNLWIGSSAGLMYYDQFEQKFFQQKKELQFNITSIAEDKAGNLWIGSNNGLIKLNTKNDEFEIFQKNNENSIAGNYVNRVFVDQSGIIWTASYNAGITKIILSPSNFKLLQSKEENLNSLSHGNIKSIAEDENGNIYIGTYNSKINVYNSEKEKLSF